ncbi:MAG: Thioredoxin [Candidatus Methanofastidiosum methylothiophilum]|uniref:Thioredoxin n=1 Tax=Candidatus Methanofastidiosum methylothiophilum TaxID=1705564 RepID=A0A150IZE0_9EURY|nr:MAG: Thioredoxin [Candidatus Methanofastidiosum methylthiophilus]KYC47252.1 MAG: Thioredoxin [Candidatus Methanofastidiosum methylthiophilus]KYC50346.1 MAG: Thioredoxin [Candidatus Methanofastidiosum methylthiophilus]
MEKRIKFGIICLMLIGTLLMAGCNESNPDKILSESDKTEIKKILSNMDGRVDILLFTSQSGCFSCSKTETLMKELDGLSDKVALKTYDTEKNKDMATKYNIELVPAIVVVGKEDYGIKHYGFPGGKEFNPLIEAVIDSSRSRPRAPEEIERKIKSITNPVEVKIFVTPTCPYCPDMVRVANAYAIVSDKVSTVTIMSNEFEDYSKKYKISAVPTTIINDTFKKEGKIEIEEFINYLVVSS